MRAKKGHIVAAALLLLAIAVTVGPNGARGQSNAFRVIGLGVAVVGENVYLLDTANFPFGWKQLPDGSRTLPPVPASSLVNWTGQTAITDTGEGWGKVNGEWTDLGPVPGLVPTTHESWGQLKAKYAR